jgi:hypothetical protein
MMKKNPAVATPHAALCALAASLATLLIVSAVAPLTLPGVAHAAPLAAVGDHDIGALMAEAREQHDLSRMDAVLLLEDLSIEILDEGDYRTTVHRIAWIGTELGLDTYGDLRVPYRSDRAELEVHTLRLPGALSHADDYTALREMMLLHDGVEIPCIVETRYSITQRGVSALGGEDPRTQEPSLSSLTMRSHDGLWIFQKADPAVRAIFRLTAPRGMPILHTSRNGAPDPDGSAPNPSSTLLGQRTLVWKMENLDRIARPLTDDLLAHVPHVVWSAWKSWDEIGNVITTTFERACDASLQALRDSLTAAIEREPDARARAEAVAAFVNKWTRHVSYDDDHWAFEPRSASRVWETAYGHTLDRAVLAAVLFREAGLAARPIFRARTRGDIDAGIPALAWFDDMRLEITTPGHPNADASTAEVPYHAIYHPDNSSLSEAPADLAGRTVWIPGEEPRLLPGPDAGSMVVILTLEPGEDGAWTGTGYLRASGGLAPYDEMIGLGCEAKDHLATVAGAIEGAEVGEHSVTALEPDLVIAGFSLSWTEDEPDDHGRVRLTFGDPGSGVIARLPGDVHLYDERRDSPITLAHPMTQRLELRLKLGDQELADEASGDHESTDETPGNPETGDRKLTYAPAESMQETAVGRHRVSIERKGKWLHLVREIEIASTVISPDEWPELRALLLEEASQRNRTILLAVE